jgi:hypothetical protein
MLAAARTEPEKMVHAFRAKLLYPAAAVTRSERLYNMAVYEEKLAALKPLQENTEKKEKRQ